MRIFNSQRLAEVLGASCCVVRGDVPSPGSIAAAVLGHSLAQPTLWLWLLLFAGLEELEWTKALPKSCNVFME